MFEFYIMSSTDIQILNKKFLHERKDCWKILSTLARLGGHGNLAVQNFYFFIFLTLIFVSVPHPHFFFLPNKYFSGKKEKAKNVGEEEVSQRVFLF